MSTVKTIDFVGDVLNVQKSEKLANPFTRELQIATRRNWFEMLVLPR